MAAHNFSVSSTGRDRIGARVGLSIHVFLRKMSVLLRERGDGGGERRDTICADPMQGTVGGLSDIVITAMKSVAVAQLLRSSMVSLAY